MLYFGTFDLLYNTVYMPHNITLSYKTPAKQPSFPLPRSQGEQTMLYLEEITQNVSETANAIINLPALYKT